MFRTFSKCIQATGLRVNELRQLEIINKSSRLLECTGEQGGYSECKILMQYTERELYRNHAKARNISESISTDQGMELRKLEKLFSNTLRPEPTVIITVSPGWTLNMW